SRTPRGKPLKPVDLISLSGPTMTAPTRRPFSLLQRAISCASSMNLSSQALENIVNQVLHSALSLKHVPAKRPAIPALSTLRWDRGRLARIERTNERAGRPHSQGRVVPDKSLDCLGRSDAMRLASRLQTHSGRLP